MSKTHLLPGTITITRPSRGDSDYIGIEITDSASRIRFVEVRIPYAGFAQAITGHGAIECSFETRGLDRIGSQHEHKTEVILGIKSYGLDRKDLSALKALLAPYEVDGWVGNPTDLVNGHCNTPEGQKVGFSRHVNAKREPIL